MWCLSVVFVVPDVLCLPCLVYRVRHAPCCLWYAVHISCCMRLPLWLHIVRHDSVLLASHCSSASSSGKFLTHGKGAHGFVGAGVQIDPGPPHIVKLHYATKVALTRSLMIITVMCLLVPFRPTAHFLDPYGRWPPRAVVLRISEAAKDGTRCVMHVVHFRVPLRAVACRCVRRAAWCMPSGCRTGGTGAHAYRRRRAVRCQACQAQARASAAGSAGRAQAGGQRRRRHRPNLKHRNRPASDLYGLQGGTCAGHGAELGCAQCA